MKIRKCVCCNELLKNCIYYIRHILGKGTV